MSRQLSLADISDLREYEREREEFRRHVIALKKRRRVSVGPHVTLVFENRDTLRFQIQEMARVEKLISDEAIEGELRAYNPLIPEPGELSATLFIELTTDEQLREWLPRLVGIERSVVLRFADGTTARCAPDADHESQLTRDEITASVHYVRWQLDDAAVAQLAAGPVTLAVDHEHYPHEVNLPDTTISELLSDARPDTQ